jgi:hypothetical protein
MHLPRRPLVYLTYLFYHFLRLGHFPETLEEIKIIDLSKSSECPKFPQNLRSIILVSIMDELLTLLCSVCTFHQQRNPAQPTSTAANVCVTTTDRFFITVKCSKRRFQIDTGSDLCVFPAS